MIFLVRFFSSLRRVAGLALVLGFLTAHPAPVFAQEGGLVGQFRELFHFGECDALFCILSKTATEGWSEVAFGDNPDATAQQVTRFLQGAIALGIATVPAPSAGSGETFRLSALGVPVRNEEASQGPVLAERALTLGRGNLLIGANVTDLYFERLRGVSLEDLKFNIGQRNLPPDSGDALGNPTFERTYLEVRTRMAFDARVANLFLSYGITDRLDVSALIPIVHASLSGYSDAEIKVAGGGVPDAGFSFGGPSEDPKIRERSELVRAKVTGLGDISLRGKYRLSDSESRIGLAALANVRVPTGRDEDFLGSSGAWIQALGIVSMEVGAGFTSHANTGVVVRGGKGQRNAVTLALGIDSRTSSRLTITTELNAQLPLGANPLVQEEMKFHYVDASDTNREIVSDTVRTSNLPTLRDHQFDGAIGFKLRLGRFAVVGNAILPLNYGGLRSEVIWTIGIQGGF